MDGQCLVPSTLLFLEHTDVRHVTMKAWNSALQTVVLGPMLTLRVLWLPSVTRLEKRELPGTACIIWLGSFLLVNNWEFFSIYFHFSNNSSPIVFNEVLVYECMEIKTSSGEQWWHRSVTLSPGRGKQEIQAISKFKDSLVNLRPHIKSRQIHRDRW